MEQTAKQKAIEAAYGNYWSSIIDHVGFDGWLNAKSLLGDSGNLLVHSKLKGIELECMDNYSSRYCYWFRPKSLSGIENNNGWVRIESKDDLPKQQINCYFILKSNKEIFQGRFRSECFDYALRFYDESEVTHYQPIVKPKPPIY